MDISFYDEAYNEWAMWTTPDLYNEDTSSSDLISFLCDSDYSTNLNVGVSYLYFYGNSPRILPTKIRADYNISTGGYNVYCGYELISVHWEYIADFCNNNNDLFEPIPELKMGPVDTSQKPWYWGVIDDERGVIYFADDPDINMASERWRFNSSGLITY